MGKRKIYIAHKGNNGEIQTVKQHSENTAKLCQEYAIGSLKEYAYIIGLLHDIGKYSNSFQDKICGKKIRVEHSICGAHEIDALFGGKNSKIFKLIAQYCIAGHHSGLPDGGTLIDTAQDSTLHGRLKRQSEDYSQYKQDLKIPQPDATVLTRYIVEGCDNEDILYDKFAFFTRYFFSCLVDADSTDTANFTREIEYSDLNSDFNQALVRVNSRLESFVCETELQKARGRVQQQVFNKINEDSEIYLVNMPTGSGKTLCSVKYALERTIRKNKKRIIYVIPYNSIIDQTAEQFEDLFGDCVSIVRHQSTFPYDSEETNDELCDEKKHATENWDAPFIITTAVQFFDSLYDNKRSKLRKLHNMADSILVFDEAHLMPFEYLQPCLQAIAFISKYLNSESIFLTATMPDFKNIITKYALKDSKILNLIDDTSEFSKFNKCKFVYIGDVGDDYLLGKANKYNSALIIVNTRKKAKELYEKCSGKKYHLSTYMTPLDRKRVLTEVKEELLKGNEKITIISTSLIEAGVDIDAEVVFREINGLDSILQAGGRCNREGKRDEAYTFIFEFENGNKTNIKNNISKGIIDKFEDIACSDSIRYYYDEVIKACDSISKNAIHNMLYSKKPDSIPFKKYAEKFNIIDSKTESIFVVRDENSKKMLEAIKYSEHISERKLQMYICSVCQKELNDLVRQHVIENFNGIWVLTNLDYYDDNVGITFEAKDYFI